MDEDFSVKKADLYISLKQKRKKIKHILTKSSKKKTRKGVHSK